VPGERRAPRGGLVSPGAFCYTPGATLNPNTRELRMSIFDTIIAIFTQILDIAQIAGIVLQLLSLFGIGIT
jgi:hypothetical protein